jgi:hypothetical protein
MQLKVSAIPARARLQEAGDQRPRYDARLHPEVETRHPQVETRHPADE